MLCCGVLCCGVVCLFRSEVNLRTFESTMLPGLHFAGDALRCVLVLCIPCGWCVLVFDGLAVGAFLSCFCLLVSWD